MAIQYEDWAELIPITLQCLAIVPFVLITHRFERMRGVQHTRFEFMLPFVPWIACISFFALTRDERYFDWGMWIAWASGAGSLLILLDPLSNIGRLTNKVLLNVILTIVALGFANEIGPAFRY